MSSRPGATSSKPSPGSLSLQTWITGRKILRCQIFLADLADFAAMNAAWDAWVVPGHTPPRATVQAKLAKAEWKVEIVVTAAR